ncbi:tyrosine-type recombinase/integrase [Aequorivita echinoideorum]|uniref:Site-specific integrase n=1 Tax=Aequorivita echinoideorum TaxID=1549647 RepID=A0ABS5S5H6_9FLAO|nr:site-specific integrase [Aequorivita echinoideorum]MBT0607664.1 site-specific integrase [Aequorivita echinoideorum]
MAKKRYSTPKLFIPRVKGRPSVATGKNWYVSFYWRSDPNGPLDKKITFLKGINRLPTAKERRAAGKQLCKAYEKMLERGWNPVTKETKSVKKSKTRNLTVNEALTFALKIKTKNRKGTTSSGYEQHLNRFLDWAKIEGYFGMEISRFSLDNFYDFFDWLRNDYTNEKTGKNLAGTSINNHKRSLSALFTTLKNERILPVNFIKDIPDVDQSPVNNKAFTLEELKAIKLKLQDEDPYLIHFISFILYALLRPREICRLQVKDIQLDQNFLSVETKTDALSVRRIIDKMKPTIEALHLENEPPSFHIFSNMNRPRDWSDAKLKSRVDHFGERFRKIKNEMGFGSEYSIYSFRHTAIMDLFHSLQKRGMGEQEILFKLMPITQHKSVAGIKNYLRQHKKSIPPDHSEIYTIDF